METLRFLMISTHFPPFQIGGDAVMAGYLADELARIGHEVHALFNPQVYRYFRGNPRKSAMHELEESAIFRHGYVPRMHHLDSALALSIGHWRCAGQHVESLCREIRPDVVHWHNTKGFIGVPFETPGAISLYTAHDYYAICPRSNLLRSGGVICEKPRFCQLCLVEWRKLPQLWRAGGRLSLRIPRTTSIICPSEFMAKKLGAHGFGGQTVIRNFVPDPGMSSLRQRPESPILVYLGLLEPHKGPETLLEAFVASSPRHGFELQVIGEGSLREYLASEVVRLGIGNRVFLRGYLSQLELQETLSKATALIIPSEWYENAPLVALEALAKGVVVVGSDIGGLPEILNHDSGALLYRAGDADKLANAIIRLWEERDNLNTRRRLARRAYETRFTPTIHLQQYLKKIHGPRTESRSS